MRDDGRVNAYNNKIVFFCGRFPARVAAGKTGEVNYNIIILRAGRRPHAAIAFIILFILGGQRRDYYYNISIDFLVHDSPVHLRPVPGRRRRYYVGAIPRHGPIIKASGT